MLFSCLVFVFTPFSILLQRQRRQQLQLRQPLRQRPHKALFMIYLCTNWYTCFFHLFNNNYVVVKYLHQLVTTITTATTTTTTSLPLQSVVDNKLLYRIIMQLLLCKTDVIFIIPTCPHKLNSSCRYKQQYIKTVEVVIIPTLSTVKDDIYLAAVVSL